LNTLSYVVTLCHGIVRGPTGELEPTKAGKQRLVSSHKALEARKTFAHIICGGERTDGSQSGAATYGKWFTDLFPDYTDRLIILPTGKNTPDNAKGLAKFLRDETWRLRSDLSLSSLIPDVLFSTHPNHARLAGISLKHFCSVEPWLALSVGCVPSPEDPPYPNWVQSILDYVTEKDPPWETWRSQWLRYLTSLRGNPPA